MARPRWRRAGSVRPRMPRDIKMRTVIVALQLVICLAKAHQRLAQSVIGECSHLSGEQLVAGHRTMIRIGFSGTSTAQTVCEAHLRSIEGAKAVSAMLPAVRRSVQVLKPRLGYKDEMRWLTARPFLFDLVRWVATTPRLVSLNAVAPNVRDAIRDIRPREPLRLSGRSIRRS